VVESSTGQNSLVASRDDGVALVHDFDLPVGRWGEARLVAKEHVAGSDLLGGAVWFGLRLLVASGMHGRMARRRPGDGRWVTYAVFLVY
jgi:hypothetical protein